MRKKNHYLPRMYIKAFRNNQNRVQSYNKVTGDLRSAKPEKIAVKIKLYILENVEKEKADLVERLLAEKVEGPSAIALRKLREGIFPNPVEREMLCFFFGTLLVRTPLYLNHIKQQLSKYFHQERLVNAQNKDSFHNDYRKLYPELTDLEIEDNRQEILSGKFFEDIRLEPSPNVVLDKMLKMADICSFLLNSMRWSLIKTNANNPFITTDNPLNLYNPFIPANSYYPPGLGSEGTCIFIPVSPIFTLMMARNDNFIDGKIFDVSPPEAGPFGEVIDEKYINKLNKEIAKNAHKYIFFNFKFTELRKILS